MERTKEYQCLALFLTHKLISKDEEFVDLVITTIKFTKLLH